MPAPSRPLIPEPTIVTCPNALRLVGLKENSPARPRDLTEQSETEAPISIEEMFPLTVSDPS